MIAAWLGWHDCWSEPSEQPTTHASTVEAMKIALPKETINEQE
jgi:hypothetical protein